MTSDEKDTDDLDELELLRREARALGMPSEISPSSVGITLRSADEILARARTRTTDPSDGAAAVSPLRSSRKTLAIRTGTLAAAIAGVVGIALTPWQQDEAAAISPPVLEYEFANAGNIAYAPGKPAQAILLALAETAKEQPPVSGNGSTQYSLVDNWFASLEENKTAKLIPNLHESWLRPDGTLRIRERSGEPLSPDGRVRTSRRTSGASKAVIETYPAEGRDPKFVANLSSNFREAREELLDYGQCESRVSGPSRASCLYQQITSLYGEFVIPPATAAAFWKILAAEPTMRSLGTVTDRANRPGIGISFIPPESPTFRRVVIISPDTGQLLGTEDILIKNDPEVGIKAPAIYSFTALLEARYTRESGPTK